MHLRSISAWLVTALLLTSTVPAGAAGLRAPADLRAPSQPTGEQLRQNLYRLIDHYQALVGKYPTFQPLLDTLAETRQSLDKVPMSQFDALAPKMATRIGTLAQATYELDKSLGAPPVRTAVGQSSGFPSANYPDVGWEFFIPGSGSTNGADAEDSTHGGVCNSTRQSAQTLFLEQAAVLLAEAGKEIASRLCEEDILGENISLVCIITDVLFLVERGIQDFTLLCEDLIDSAEIEGAYDRLGHLHTDLADAQTALTTEIDANQTLIEDVDADLAAHDANIDGDLAAHDANLTSRADAIDDTLDQQAAFLLAFREENLRHHIEANLSSSSPPIADFVLPESVGGHLETVRTIVEETLANAAAAGLRSGSADQQFAKAEQALNRGDYPKAYHFYTLAYQAAIGTGGP